MHAKGGEDLWKRRIRSWRHCVQKRCTAGALGKVTWASMGMRVRLNSILFADDGHGRGLHLSLTAPRFPGEYHRGKPGTLSADAQWFRGGEQADWGTRGEDEKSRTRDGEHYLPTVEITERQRKSRKYDRSCGMGKTYGNPILSCFSTRTLS